VEQVDESGLPAGQNAGKLACPYCGVQEWDTQLGLEKHLGLQHPGKETN
jgi:hypothetical protein